MKACQSSRFSSNVNFIALHGIHSTAQLFQMLQEPPTAVDSCSVIELCNVYSYNNAPSILLSLNLLLLSFANTFLSIVQLLQDEMDDDDYGGSSSNKKKVWQPCTIAMKRANGKYASQLKSDDLHKAHAFARLV